MGEAMSNELRELLAASRKYVEEACCLGVEETDLLARIDAALATSDTRPDGMPANKSERLIRRLLAARVGGYRAYMDDGEASVEISGITIDFMREPVEAIKSKLAQIASKQWQIAIGSDFMRMALCPTCGNKRCPKAANHNLACSGRNAPGRDAKKKGGR